MYNKYEHEIESENPTMLYSKIISTAYERIATQINLTYTPEEATAAGESIRNWKPFPDTVDALRRLGQHYKLIILSNVDLQSFSYTKPQLEQGFMLDKILTAQEIGSYKPDHRNFLYMINVAQNEFGIPKEQVLVTAQSLKHDHAPANELGLRSVWINRVGGGLVKEGVRWDWEFSTLGEMADALEAELAQPSS